MRFHRLEICRTHVHLFHFVLARYLVDCVWVWSACRWHYLCVPRRGAREIGCGLALRGELPVTSPYDLHPGLSSSPFARPMEKAASASLPCSQAHGAYRKRWTRLPPCCVLMQEDYVRASLISYSLEGMKVFLEYPETPSAEGRAYSIVVARVTSPPTPSGAADAHRPGGDGALRASRLSLPRFFRLPGCFPCHPLLKLQPPSTTRHRSSLKDRCICPLRRQKLHCLQIITALRTHRLHHFLGH